jgi:hypothetical protein
MQIMANSKVRERFEGKSGAAILKVSPQRVYLWKYLPIRPSRTDGWASRSHSFLISYLHSCVLCTILVFTTHFYGISFQTTQS